MRRARAAHAAAGLLLLGANALAAPPGAAPRVLYTDLASGPSSGGENNRGAYLSVFGKNFGSAGLGTRTRVFIGGAEVAGYRYLGASKGRADIQQISVQVGALGAPTPGVALPVVVSVDGVTSNSDVAFTVNPGRLLYVDNVHGDDNTAVAGDIAHPYRHVQLPDTSKAAFGALQPGDIIVMRGTGTPWTDLGNDTYFVKFIHLDGSAPSGASGSGPLTLMAYPTEDVFIDVNGPATHKGALSGIDTTSGIAGGHWVTLAGLRIESGGNSGVIATQVAGDHWRIVNNELSAASATNSARAGGINGNATNAYWVGNHIHDIAGGAAQESHGIYIDGDGSYEIAFNRIEHVTGGNGLQIFVNGSNGSDFGDDVYFHHNLVRDVSKHGLNVADGARNNIVLANNVVNTAAYGCLRFNSGDLRGAKIYNNTFYNCDTAGTSGLQAAVMNDAVPPADAFDLRNNVVVPAPGKPYSGGSVGIGAGMGTIDRNLWFGGTGAVAFDAGAIKADPQFAGAAGADFHLAAASAAIDAGGNAVAAVVTDDFDAVFARPVGAGFDIGAFEYLAGFVHDRIFADAFE